MTRRAATRRGRDARPVRSLKRSAPGVVRALPASPAATRARTFAQWALGGALAGSVLSVIQQQSPWEGATLLSNIAQAAGAGLATGLVALGACWIWLARQT